MVGCEVCYSQGTQRAPFRGVALLVRAQESISVQCIDNHANEGYIGIRTCEIALKIIDAGLGEDEGRALEPLDNMAVAGALFIYVEAD